jgi:hypothetical protein
VRECNAGEAAGKMLVGQARVGSKLVASPEDDRKTARLEEHRLLDLLAAPAEPFVEGARPREIGDAEGDQADPLLHVATLP